jgi:hypothetical protein
MRGSTVRIVAELPEELRARGQGLLQTQNKVPGSDPRLVVATCRAAVAIGLMETVVLK